MNPPFMITCRRCWSSAALIDNVVTGRTEGDDGTSIVHIRVRIRCTGCWVEQIIDPEESDAVLEEITQE